MPWPKQTREEGVSKFWSRFNKRGPFPSDVAISIHPEIKGTRCWEWTGCVSLHGYGIANLVRLFGEERVHRLAYLLTHSEKPITGKTICHKCDNRICGRPLHLFKATQKENRKDCVLKNRQVKGEHQHSSKLRSSDIPKIIKLRKKGMSGPKIGELFGVHSDIVYGIMHGRIWKHVSEKFL